MELIEPELNFSGNWEALAKRFGYEIGPHDQDWTYTIVEEQRIQEYINAYRNEIFDDLARIGLMEMIIQSNCDQPTEELRGYYWPQVKELLEKDFELNKYTIWYWCLWDTEDPDNLWEIAPQMRELWKSM